MTTFNARHALRHLALLLVLAMAGCGRSDVPSLIASAKSYLEKSDTNAAIVQLKSALQEAPDNAEARFLLGRSLLENGDPAAAETEIRKALELKYPPDEGYPLLARALLTQGQFRKVISEFGARKLDSTQARADLGTSVALAHLALGDSKSASAAVDAALAGLPGDARALTVKAQIAARANDLDEATRLIGAALALAPNDLEASVVKAQLEVAQGRRDQAIKTLEGAVETNPRGTGARFALVSLLVTSGQLDKAAAQVDAMKKTAPHQFGTAYADALVAYSRGDAARAREALQPVLAAKPDYLPSLYLSGLVEYRLGSFATAEDALRKVVAQTPNAARAQQVLASIYLRTGRGTQAIETLEVALQNAPDDPALLRAAGEAYFGAGNPAKAALYYERANTIDKGDVTSNVRLAEARFAAGDTARAVSDLESLSAADASQYQADLALITAHLRRREFDLALAAVATLEKKQPLNPLTYNVKGVVYTTKRDYKNARAAFDKALEVDPGFFTAARNLAMLDVQEHKAEDARKRYEKMLANDPKSEPLLLALAELLALTGHPADEVKAAIEQAIATNSAAVGPRLALVAYYTRLHDAKAALAAAQSANAAFPNETQVIEALGAAQLAAGEPNQALETFRRLAQLQPQNAAALMRVAEAQVAVKDYQGAVNTLQAVLTIRPDERQAWFALANVYFLSGHSEDALTEARRLQKEHPDRALGYMIEGEILTAQKKWPDAATAYGEALARQPVPILAVRRYTALREMGKTDEATAFANKWMREHPRDPTFHEFLAEQSLAKKEYKAAAAQFQAALESDPDNTQALNNLAYALTEMGDPRATEYAERAFRQVPNNSRIVDTLGWALLQTGDTSRGTQLLRAASNLDPSDPDIRLHFAQALLKSGDKASARRELEKLAKLDQPSPARAEAQKLLAGL